MSQTPFEEALKSVFGFFDRGLMISGNDAACPERRREPRQERRMAGLCSCGATLLPTG